MIGFEEIEARFLGRSAGDESCFWTRAGRGYRDGLVRMAELAPEDPFWTGTNGTVTEHKLAPFCDLLLQHDPHDRRALWTSIGLDVHFCSNVLHEQRWRDLHELGDFRPHWLLEHAYWVFAISGKDTAPLVGELLRRHHLVEVTRAELHALVSTDAGWVERVVASTA